MDTVDIVAFVSRENDRAQRKRDTSVPIWDEKFDWWTIAVRRKLRERGIKQKELSEIIGAQEPEVSRCINRSKPLFEILIAISDELEIPYPVILPESESEALYLATQRRLIRRDLQVAQIAAGVADTSEEDQSEPVPSEHVIRPRKSKRKTSQRPRPEPR